MKSAGADQNAYTTDDYTNYHVTFTKADDMRAQHRALKHLDRRPAKSMPGGIEHPHRHPGVDDPGARQNAGIQPVRPGTREQRQGFAGGSLAEEGGGQLMCVLADAGARAKGRPIVQQDAQTGKW